MFHPCDNKSNSHWQADFWNEGKKWHETFYMKMIFWWRRTSKSVPSLSCFGINVVLVTASVQPLRSTATLLHTLLNSLCTPELWKNKLQKTWEQRIYFDGCDLARSMPPPPLPTLFSCGRPWGAEGCRARGVVFTSIPPSLSVYSVSWSLTMWIHPIS